MYKVNYIALYYTFLDLSIMPMKNDINNMQGHINDILAAQGSLSGNLSHVQNDLHDLYGMKKIVLLLLVTEH